FAGFNNTDAVSQNSIETFNTTSKTWGNANVRGGAFNKLARSFSVSANTATSGLGLNLFLGGAEKYGSESQNPRGLITFDASDPKELKWTNETKGAAPLVGATMQYARFGNQGVLIAVGGYKGVSALKFDVTASGDVPIALAHFCSTISPSPDDSSYQMTIYGGFNIENHRAYETVYVLTIPAFQWIKILDTGNQESRLPGQNIGRHEHTCHLYGDRQMVMLGGQLSFQDVAQNNETCNPLHPVIRILDTTTFEWQTDFIPMPEPYVVPKAVIDVIGGSTLGEATMISPVGGFQDSTLDKIFKRSVPRYKESVVSTKSAVTNANSEEKPKSSQRSPKSSPSSFSTSLPSKSLPSSWSASSLSPPTVSPSFSSPSASTPSAGSSIPVGPVVGSVIGGIVGVAAL
ncbi:MAG: hypothetical protein Q9164_006270, partial [Protoblastenia rupestris]